MKVASGRLGICESCSQGIKIYFPDNTILWVLAMAERTSSCRFVGVGKHAPIEREYRPRRKKKEETYTYMHAYKQEPVYTIGIGYIP
ncbi:hypothetical protein VNO77_33010 [Canavalia gladiata]|uniref:Uncharacterized protein n=1 Tax=Canavalia gladiata TaxID=3824 RepID=A0AAN9KAY0_CANGL